MHDIKGAYTIWYRDVLRFVRDRSRIFGSLAQPLLFLFALGFGLGGALEPSGQRRAGDLPGGPFIEFLYPGILCMTVLFTALFSAISIVWDREFGFLARGARRAGLAHRGGAREGRGRLDGGDRCKEPSSCCSGRSSASTTASAASFCMLLTLLLVAAVITSLGILIAARQKTMEGFQVIMQFLLLPMLFLSGAFFPFQGSDTASRVLRTIAQFNPLTYGVDAIRRSRSGRSSRLPSPCTPREWMR